MVKVKHGVSSRKRRKKALKAVKGQYGSRSRLLRTAKEAARKAMIANYDGRKKNKSNFRSLWITRINAACEEEGISYSKLIAGLKRSGIAINRKMLADIAVNDSSGFKAIVKKAQ